MVMSKFATLDNRDHVKENKTS